MRTVSDIPSEIPDIKTSVSKTHKKSYFLKLILGSGVRVSIS